MPVPLSDIDLFVFAHPSLESVRILCLSFDWSLELVSRGLLLAILLYPGQVPGKAEFWPEYCMFGADGKSKEIHSHEKNRPGHILRDFDIHANNIEAIYRQIAGKRIV